MIEQNGQDVWSCPCSVEGRRESWRWELDWSSQRRGLECPERGRQLCFSVDSLWSSRPPVLALTFIWFYLFTHL